MGVGRIGLAGVTAAVLGLGGGVAPGTPVRHAAAEAALNGRTTPDAELVESGISTAEASPPETGTATANAAGNVSESSIGGGVETAPVAAVAGAPAAVSRPHRHRHHRHRHHAKRRARAGGGAAGTGPAAGHHSTTPKQSKKHGTTTPTPGTTPPPAVPVVPAAPGASGAPVTPPVPSTGPDSAPTTPPGRTGIALTGPALMLATGIAALKSIGYNVDETIGHNGNLDLTQHGSVDPAGHAANLDATGTANGIPVHTGVRQIGNSLWTLMDLGSMQSSVGGNPTKWMAVDRGQLNRPDDTLVNLSGNTDPLDIAGLMAKVTNLEQASPTYVTGLVDLTASTGVSAPAPEQLAYAGDPATATPFTAAVDDHGRLISLQIDADSISPDLSRTFTFSQFGAPSPVVAPPTGQVIAAPDSVYQYFNAR